MSSRVHGRGFHSVYARGQLTLGIGFPIEAYSSPVPDMLDQIALTQDAEQGGFAAVWSRDVPLLDPSFGDAGQIYDPWVWLGYVAAQTSDIALATGSSILPLRRPVDTAKAAASIDQLTGGRLVMGVASGDRPVEYSVYEVDFESRDETFRNVFDFIRTATHRPAGWDIQQAAKSAQLTLLPKSYAGDLPLFVTGYSRQTMEWIAANADGWLMYPRPAVQQRDVVNQWHNALEAAQQEWKPFSQSLYIDLTTDPDTPPTPIHLGLRMGRNSLLTLLRELKAVGVNHVAFYLRFQQRPMKEVVAELCEYVVPEFPRL
ncbi:hypothetical protein AB833_29205 [Chromatiales bacterium (ex Bugula neritina AB1)]|nr:hypothetical protein AB833_29205 [Chromatiales bacterium (ex Bugula neritina AB1)]